MRSGGVVLLVIGLLLPAVAGCSRSGAQQAAEREAITVRTEPASIGAIRETIRFSGEVAAAGSEVQVMPKVGGRIAGVAVTVGQEVARGDLLVRLEAEELALAVRQAEAGLELVRAKQQNAKTSGTLAELQATARQAEANYNNAVKILERMEQLYRKGVIALQQLEDAQLQARVAESQHDLASEQLEVFERGGGDLRVLAAQARQAEAELEMARLNLSRTRIVAPIAGRVLLLNAEPGDMAFSDSPVVSLLGKNGVTVNARVTEQFVGMFLPGKEVEVEAPATGARLSGTAQEVFPGAAAGTFRVKIRVEGAEGLRPGMFARINPPTGENPAAVLAPRAAVLEQGGRYFVFTVHEGRAVRREVTPGLRDGKFVEIMSGVAAGEAVVTTGHQFLYDGAAVRLELGKGS